MVGAEYPVAVTVNVNGMPTVMVTVSGLVAAWW
jgi:hypothetical protein